MKWKDYEKGFGNLSTEFWYGLTFMHCLTQRGQWEMRIDYQRNDKTWSYYHYNRFSVGSASEKYPLTIGGFTGEGIDQFNHETYSHNGTKFTTTDNVNDGRGCAAGHKSRWWYNGCHQININRQPPNENGTTADTLHFTEMKIRPKDCIIQ